MTSSRSEPAADPDRLLCRSALVRRCRPGGQGDQARFRLGRDAADGEALEPAAHALAALGPGADVEELAQLTGAQCPVGAFEIGKDAQLARLVGEGEQCAYVVRDCRDRGRLVGCGQQAGQDAVGEAGAEGIRV